MRVLPLIFFSLTFLFPVGISASEPPVRYETTIYNTDNGLPQNSVKSIAFDRAGFCWLATEMGLVRFDGRNFKVFGPGFNGISSSRAHYIIANRAGDLQVNFINDTKADIVFKGQGAISQPVSSGRVKALHSRSGFALDEMMIDSLGASLNMGSIWNWFDLGLDHNKILGLDYREGYVFLDSKMYYINNGSIHSYDAGNDAARQMILLDSLCLSIEKGNKVRVWDKMQVFLNSATIEGELARESDYLTGNYKALWCVNGSFIYCNQSLYQLVRSGMSIRSVKVLDHLQVKDIRSINVDTVNRIYYIGSNIDGLYVIRPTGFFVPSLPDEAIARDQNYYTQAVIDDDRLFCRELMFSRKTDTKLISIGSDQPSILQVLSKNKVYFGKRPDLLVYDFSNNSSKKIATLDGRITGMLLDKTKQDLCVMTERTIYLLSNDSVHSQFAVKLKAGIISCFIKEDDKHFILGSTTGLHWYSANGEQIEKTILDSINIRTLYKEQDGKLWIGTYGDGFFMYEKNQLKKFPAGPLNSLNTVHAFVDDGRGYFWIPTNNGLFKVSKDELHAYASGKIDEVYYYMFNKRDGLPTNEFNGGFQLPYAWFADSMLSLPTLDGLVWFYPHSLKSVFPDKAIYLDKAILDDKDVSGEGTRFEVPPGNHTLSLWFTSPYFGNPHNMHLEYLIKGATNAWKTLPVDGRINLQNMQAGNYRILLRKRDGNSFSSFDELSLTVTVKPFFYQKWWFPLLVLLIIFLLACKVFMWRTQTLKRRADTLEQKVKDRTEELKQMIEWLEKSEKSLAESVETKDQVISLVLHDLQSPIRFLDILSQRLARDQADLDSDSLKQRILEIKSSTSSLYSFATQFFAWAKSQHSRFSVKVQWVALKDIFHNISLLYQDILKSKNNVLVTDDGNLACYIDPDLLTIILRNLVDNAHKNTTDGKVMLSARMHNDELEITLNDTGTGMDESRVAAFLNKKLTSVEGLGGIVVTTLLSKMGGRIAIESKVGEGTTFLIHLPCHP